MRVRVQLRLGTVPDAPGAASVEVEHTDLTAALRDVDAWLAARVRGAGHAPPVGEDQGLSRKREIG